MLIVKIILISSDYLVVYSWFVFVFLNLQSLLIFQGNHRHVCMYVICSNFQPHAIVMPVAKEFIQQHRLPPPHPHIYLSSLSRSIIAITSSMEGSCYHVLKWLEYINKAAFWLGNSFLKYFLYFYRRVSWDRSFVYSQNSHFKIYYYVPLRLMREWRHIISLISYSLSDG